MIFLGLGIKDKVPDAKTIWLFKERLIEGKVSEKLFDKFGREPAKQNLIGKEGTIIDATIVEAPIQHNGKEENGQIKQEEIPQGWQGEKHKAKLCQKDRDARWTKKQSRSYFGYKYHVKTDVKSKFIVKATVTAAHVHDSQEVEHLTKKGDTILYGDSAYIGERIEKILKKKKIEGHICERAYRNKPLTQEQKESNREKSRIRARIEHGERFYDEYDERYICKNDRISSCNILNNNDEPYV